MTLVTNDNKLMPVIRSPIFSDVTEDLPIESFNLRVGDNGEMVTLKEYIQNLDKYTDIIPITLICTVRKWMRMLCDSG
jgi:hypothetical protein